MEKSRRRTGLGDRAVSRLLRHIAKNADGTCIENDKGYRLSFPDNEPVFVAHRPNDAASWETRLRWVEKQSAAFLLNAPILFGLRDKAKKGRRTNALRLSFGLSLSLGRPLRKRYCVTVKEGASKGVLTEGDEVILGEGWEEYDVLSLPSWTRSCLPILAKEVAATYEAYGNEDYVVTALEGIAEQRREEFIFLEDLYRRKSGANDRLFGLPMPNLDGSTAIEAELRGLQEVVLSRYEVKLRIKVLSLGVYENVSVSALG
ncbi:hypothetical protein [Bradyrhizobium japonicum]|uniref:hypothetical protein n=1 Tax=Bradyrhizobium japonicum TaxID=375 RepID=UPI0011816631|nr:hypothetical protein [Bradyrhizobium japonicum]